MSRAVVPDVPLTRPQRKKYFPFRFGMRSQPDQGVGASLAINAMCNKDGHVIKTKGIQLIGEHDDANNLEATYEHRKSDGTVQTINIYFVDAGAGTDYYVMRIIEEDGTIGTPVGPEENLTGSFTFTTSSPTVTATGGKFTEELHPGDWIYSSGESGNAAQVLSIESDTSLTLAEDYTGAGASSNGKRASVHFLGDQFDFDDTGGVTVVSNNNATTNLYTFNGTTLTKVTNITGAIYSVATDGNRIAASMIDHVKFSSSDTSSTNNWTSGAGVEQSGQYGTSIAYPKAVCKGGDGIIIWGEVGAEAHQVIPNAASDDVSSKTKLETFTYKGRGISHPRQCQSGDYFVYFANNDRIGEMNPYNGKVSPLSDIGAISALWEEIDKSRIVVGVDPSSKRLVVIAKTYGMNDTAIVFDTDQKDRPCMISRGQYYHSLGVVNGYLYGGSSRDGKVYQLFSSRTDVGDSQQVFKYRIEKDGLEGVPLYKTFRKFALYCELHPKAELTVRVYIDDDVDPTFEKTYGTTNKLKNASASEQYGKYEFRIGQFLKESANNSIRLSQKNARFNRISIEIEERSARPFKLKDIIMEYKTRARFVRKYLSSDVS